MDPGKMDAIWLEAAHPTGIAARIDSQDLRKLLEERKDLLKSCKRLRSRLKEALRMGACGVQFDEGQSAVKEADTFIASAEGRELIHG